MANIEEIITGEEKQITADQIIPGGLYCRRIKEYRAMHFGIGVENGNLIDLNNSRDHYAIRQITFYEFARDLPVYQVDCSKSLYGKKSRSLEETVEIAKSSLNIKRPYHIMFFNCGMFAFYCKLQTTSQIDQIHPLIGQNPPLPLVKYY